ncbi:MAG: thymidine phosphorylase [Treponema sp.]|jgi:pyrimidine-nucleoside phosphorylase|nr:thymidine phosphorylase [Treponema sp.]
MRAVDIIMAKRDGRELSREELGFLINGFVAGTIPDYQVSAWAMAVFFRGMSPAETAALTETMLDSGGRMNLAGIPGPLVDKHSTGGVGDKTSLILAPLAASLGLRDPMMSGRALGHTGGTLDKLESIPGYRTALSPAEFREILARDGFAMTGQTRDTVPADRLLYALRDLSATVESVPLITASILSKKKAEGAEALVLDVKFGSGAFMRDPAEAEGLARSLADTGAALGLRIIALLTSMDQPLGSMVGNFLEVEECYACLDPARYSAPPRPGSPEHGLSADLMELTLELGARMLMLGGRAGSPEEGRKLCLGALAGGKPRDLFLGNIESQGGDRKRFLEMLGSYRSPHRAEIRAREDGYVSRIDARKVGQAGIVLGVGRNRREDPVSPVAGLQLHKKAGSPVRRGDSLMTVWGKDRESLEAAIPALEGAAEYAASPPSPEKLVIKEIRHG